MKRFTLMVSFLTLLCLNIVAQNFELDEIRQSSSNMFTEEEYRASTSVAPTLYRQAVVAYRKASILV